MLAQIVGLDALPGAALLRPAQELQGCKYCLRAREDQFRSAGLRHHSTHARRCSRQGRATVRARPEKSASVPPPYGPGTIREIPVFPLGIVSFPTATVPLNIFEARYRVLFNTLLAGLPGIEEDLVNDQKPWCGSRLFGMCFVNQEGGMASIGTTLYILKHDRLPNGRLLVVNKGLEKFRILKVIEERPVLVCQVEMLDDADDSSSETAAAASETIQLFKDLIQLNVKMKRIPSVESGLDPQIDTMSPREVSYWLGLVFSQSPLLQQALLEEKSLFKRISLEREILEGTTKYLRAQVALQSAFATNDAPSATEGSAEAATEATAEASSEASAEAGISESKAEEQKEEEPPPPSTEQ